MAWNPKQIVELLQECGGIAVDMQRSARRSIKADNTLVTEADTRVEMVLTEGLKSSGSFFIGEETARGSEDEYHRRALEGSCYVIDPIDGTLLYANGLPGWGISVGYMEGGRFAEGAILYPMSGELLVSSGEDVLYACDRQKVCPDFADLSPLAPPESAGPFVTVNQTLAKRGVFRGSINLLSTGSCVSSILYLARGGIRAYLTKSRLWDIAGGIPLLRRLGIGAYAMDGVAFSGRVEKEYWHIPPSISQTYWQMRQTLVFCAGVEVFEEVMGSIESR